MSASNPEPSTGMGLPPDTAILIVAPNASTVFGGEAVLPVHYFRILRARGFKVSLVAHARNREDLMAVFGADCAGLHFVEDTIWHRTLWRLGSVLPGKINAATFGLLLDAVNERYQARQIRTLRAAGRVDLIHQPIPVSPKAPSSIYGFGVPVVIGPMNGGMGFPPGYEDYESWAERRFVPVARRLAFLVNRLIPGKRRAAALLVANPRTRAALPVRHDRVIDLVENGVDLATFPPAPRPERTPGPFRLVFMGRLVDWKAVEITLEALALVRRDHPDITLDILGDGAERSALEARAAALGLGPGPDAAVRFHGFRPQADCAEVLRGSDALILNSLYECGGAVVLEAMSIGLPVIASDWGGPADYLDATCGVLVSPVPRGDFAVRLSQAILRLAGDPDLCRAMGAAGAARIRADFDWDRKVDRMLGIYAEALAAPDARDQS